jgi:hypothetical protein
LNDSDFITTNGYQRSNLGRRSRHGRLRQGRRGGGSSPELGVARATGHHFQRGVTLRTWRIQGKSPRGSSNGEGDRSRARDAGLLAPTFDDVEDELQWSTDVEIRLRGGGTTHRRAMWCWLGTAGLQQSDGELGWWLGFQYLWIKIHRRTGTIYKAFYTKS